MRLEDDFCDIVKKARLGQGMTVHGLASASGLQAELIAAVEREARTPSEPDVEAIARGLRLRPRPLADIAAGRWHPSPPSISGVDTILGDIGGYAVKGYVLHDGGEAIMIDTAYNPDAMIETVRRLGATLKAVCLTHGHADHAEGLDEIVRRWCVPVYLGRDDEALLSWTPPADLLQSPRDGECLSVGRLQVRCITTPGHTPGGTCYRVDGLEQPICFVGDTLFAGSIGRSNPSSLYPVHLASVRTRVLTLPLQTALFPGHGPATTVRQELEHNPFAVAHDER